MTSAIQLAQLGDCGHVDGGRLARDSEQLAARTTRLYGPGAAAVRAAARALVVAIELYEQQQRRLRAETLRVDES